MTNKLNRSDYLILDTLHGSNMTDQFHSMTIEEIMEETGNVLGVRMTVYRMVTKLVKLGYLEKGVMDNHAKCSTQSIMESLRIEKEYILFLLRKNWIMGSLNFQCHLTMVHV